ncbi:hypothetical protein J6590_052257 [Homalodisca vitripennis]|nr:hypothetical protein J6590_052257 [Homalodisca vitripennis]
MLTRCSWLIILVMTQITPPGNFTLVETQLHAHRKESEDGYLLKLKSKCQSLNTKMKINLPLLILLLPCSSLKVKTLERNSINTDLTDTTTLGYITGDSPTTTEDEVEFTEPVSNITETTDYIFNITNNTTSSINSSPSSATTTVYTSSGTNITETDIATSDVTTSSESLTHSESSHTISNGGSVDVTPDLAVTSASPTSSTVSTSNLITVTETDPDTSYTKIPSKSLTNSESSHSISNDGSVDVTPDLPVTSPSPTVSTVSTSNLITVTGTDPATSATKVPSESLTDSESSRSISNDGSVDVTPDLPVTSPSPTTSTVSTSNLITVTGTDPDTSDTKVPSESLTDSVSPHTISNDGSVDVTPDLAVTSASPTASTVSTSNLITVTGTDPATSDTTIHSEPLTDSESSHSISNDGSVDVTPDLAVSSASPTASTVSTSNLITVTGTDPATYDTKIPSESLTDSESPHTISNDVSVNVTPELAVTSASPIASTLSTSNLITVTGTDPATSATKVPSESLTDSESSRSISNDGSVDVTPDLPVTSPSPTTSTVSTSNLITVTGTDPDTSDTKVPSESLTDSVSPHTISNDGSVDVTPDLAVTSASPTASTVSTSNLITVTGTDPATSDTTTPSESLTDSESSHSISNDGSVDVTPDLAVSSASPTASTVSTSNLITVTGTDPATYDTKIPSESLTDSESPHTISNDVSVDVTPELAVTSASPTVSTLSTSNLITVTGTDPATSDTTTPSESLTDSESSHSISNDGLVDVTPDLAVSSASPTASNVSTSNLITVTGTDPATSDTKIPSESLTDSEPSRTISNDGSEKVTPDLVVTSASPTASTISTSNFVSVMETEHAASDITITSQLVINGLFSTLNRLNSADAVTTQDVTATSLPSTIARTFLSNTTNNTSIEDIIRDLPDMMVTSPEFISTNVSTLHKQHNTVTEDTTPDISVTSASHNTTTSTGKNHTVTEMSAPNTMVTSESVFKTISSTNLTNNAETEITLMSSTASLPSPISTPIEMNLTTTVANISDSTVTTSSPTSLNFYTSLTSMKTGSLINLLNKTVTSPSSVIRTDSLPTTVDTVEPIIVIVSDPTLPSSSDNVTVDLTLRTDNEMDSKLIDLYTSVTTTLSTDTMGIVTSEISNQNTITSSPSSFTANISTPNSFITTFIFDSASRSSRYIRETSPFATTEQSVTTLSNHDFVNNDCSPKIKLICQKLKIPIKTNNPLLVIIFPCCRKRTRKSGPTSGVRHHSN